MAATRLSAETLSSSFLRAKISLQPSDQGVELIRTVSELIEHNAEHNSQHLFCLQARKGTAELLRVSHLQLKQSILQCSAWLVANITEVTLPRKVDNGLFAKCPPLALFMESNVGLLIHVYSCISSGIPVLVLSARLSPTAVAHLLSTTHARAIIVTPRLYNVATEALSLFAAAEVPPALYLPGPYETFLESPPSGGNICAPGYNNGETDRDVLILHSSGTTGLPKPIYTSHRYQLGFPTCHRLNNEEAQCLNVSLLPLYHGFGFVAPGLSLGIGMTVCLPASSLVPTGASTVELLKLTNARSLMTVPSTLEEISLLPNQEGIKALLLLQFVAFGGGPLKSSVGENLSAAGVRLLNHYGATEIGPLAPIFVPAMDYDWQYFRLRKDYPLRVEKIPVSEDGTQQYQLIARPFGWETPFESQDRLVTNPKHRMTDFNAVGRNDDVIVLATGEKVLPGILESLLSESDLVKIAIAFGDGQFELGVIVQPAMPLSLADYAQFKSAIWPTILQAGDRMDAHARISSQEAIIVASPEMVFPRSDKGSMMRKEVYKLLEAEIAEAYKRLDNSIIDDSLPLLDMDHVEEELKDMVQYRLNWRIQNHEWTYDDDLFELGMDSLQAVRLRRFILATLPKHARLLPLAERVGRDFVYRHPSITKMATVLRSSDLLNNTAIESQDRIAEYVQQYSLKQPEIRNMGREIGSVVLLTGSTGSLGSYLLAHLAGLPGVARVVCLNRPPQHASQSQDPHERQVQAFRTRGIRVSPEVWSKIQIMQTTSAAPFLGMEDTEYMHLRGQVTHIVHNAFPMDFKMILPSFASQFQTLQNLLQLARDAHAMCSSTRPKILFVSSIAVAGQYPSAYGERVVPEISLDNNCINRLGYAEAKMVCERIIEKAAEEFQNEIDPTFVRVGQLSGSKMSGFWNSDEHMTALMKSSQSIGRLPLIEGTLSWLPVDCAAEAISELLLTTRPTDLVYHLENPVRQPWQDALTLIASKLGFSDTDLLPFDDWLDTVSMSAGDENPAKLLIDFFKADFRHMACGNVMLSTENAQKVSSTLREMDVISDATISAYIDRWRSIGFLR